MRECTYINVSNTSCFPSIWQYIKALPLHCCDRKSRPAYAQSFTPWQQATIEIMLAISLTIACLRYTLDGVILHAHPVRSESHNQRNITGEVATAQNQPLLQDPGPALVD